MKIDINKLEKGCIISVPYNDAYWNAKVIGISKKYNRVSVEIGDYMTIYHIPIEECRVEFGPDVLNTVKSMWTVIAECVGLTFYEYVIDHKEFSEKKVKQGDKSYLFDIKICNYFIGYEWLNGKVVARLKEMNE